MGCQSCRVWVLESKVVLAFELIHLIFSLRVFIVDFDLLLLDFWDYWLSGVDKPTILSVHSATIFVLPALIQNVVSQELFIVVKFFILTVEPSEKLSVSLEFHLIVLFPVNFSLVIFHIAVRIRAIVSLLNQKVINIALVVLSLFFELPLERIFFVFLGHSNLSKQI